MEELKITSEELKEIIELSKPINHGFFGQTFLYGNKLIKLDRGLYDLLKVNDKRVSDEMFDYYYRFDGPNFANLEQIKTLCAKQKKITLTQLPKGIVEVKGKIPGVILPYHSDYQNLSLINDKDYRTLLIILKKLLLAVRELADNEISHEDLWQKNKNGYSYNVLQNGKEPQIIDVDGELLKVGKDYTDCQKMYEELSGVLFSFFDIYGLDNRGEKATTMDDCYHLYDELKDKLSGKGNK